MKKSVMINRLNKVLIFTLLISFLSPSLLAAESEALTLRVCVLKDVNTISVTVKGAYRIEALRTGELLKKGKDLNDASVLPTTAGLIVAGEPFNIFGIKIVPSGDASIYIDKRAFRGNMDIIRTEKKRLLAVNHINIEDYLKGVLFHEVSHWWPVEVLKAQAIAARTYAVYRMSVCTDKDFDLTSDIYSQVYGGKGSERGRTNKAVNLTRGKVLTYKGEIFPAYYHATCAGHTEDASNLWSIDLPPLKGLRCSFCKLSPHYRWKRKISIAEAQKRLSAAGYNVNGLKEIKPSGKTSSGRIKDIDIISNKKLSMAANDFRLLMDPNLIRSTNFNVKRKRDYFYFEGRGWGHGVGMCQWGAFLLAVRRYKAEHILKFYYPKTRIGRI